MAKNISIVASTGGSGGGTIAPPTVTVGTPTVATSSAETRVTFPITYPANRGTLKKLFVRLEVPYAGTPGDTATNVPPASVVTSFGPFKLTPEITITVPVAVAAVQTWGAWITSASDTVQNKYTDAGTPLVTFTVSPYAGLIEGAEWAPNPPNPIGLTIDRELRKGSEQWWRPDVTWELPSTDPRFPLVSAWDIGLLDPTTSRAIRGGGGNVQIGGQIISLGTVAPSSSAFAAEFRRVRDTPSEYTIMIRPIIANGSENSYLPGITAAVRFSVGPQNVTAGTEQAALVTAPTAVSHWDKDPTGAREFVIDCTWVNPTDPRFGGVRLNLVSAGDFAFAPGQIVTGTVTGTKFTVRLAQKDAPTTPGTWTLLFFSVDANGAVNTYLAGVTPAVSVLVRLYHVGAPTLRASGFSVASAYTDYDYNGIPELSLTVNFTPPDPAIDSSWAYVDFWAQRPDDGLWYNYFSPDISGKIFGIGQLPKVTGPWNFLLIDKDVNGKDLDGNSTTDPTAPPAGSAAFSLSIDPPSIAIPLNQATGLSVAASYTTPDNDGLQNLKLTVTFTAPSDRSWAYVDFWAQRPDDGLWYNYFSPDKSGQSFQVAQLPITSGTWNFLLIDKSVTGKDRAGNSTSDPAAPPAGSATFSLSIAPPALGASGVEYASNITSPSIVDGSAVSQPDGTYRVLETASYTAPSDTRFGGVKVIIRYTSGPLNGKDEELVDIPYPKLSQVVIWKPPAGSQTSDWYFVAYNKLGQLNTIQAGTPKVTKTVGSSSQLDFSAAKLATLNQDQLRVINGVFEAYNLPFAIFGGVQVGGGTSNGTADSSGTAIHRLSGNSFTSAVNGAKFWFNGFEYKVADSGYIDADHLTLTTSAGTQSAKNWSYGRPPLLTVFDRNNNVIFISGDDSGNSNYVGTWAGREFRAGGVDAAHPVVDVDSVGVVTIINALLRIIKTSGGVTNTLTIDEGNPFGAPLVADNGIGSTLNLGPRAVVIAGPVLTGGTGTTTLSQTEVTIENGGDYTTIRPGIIDNNAQFGVTDGLVDKYSGKAVAGMGLAPIYSSIVLGSQTASIGATNISIGGGTAPTGTYRITVYVLASVAGAGGSVALNILFNDGVAARTDTFTINFGALSYGGTTFVISTNGTAIQYSTVFTGTGGAAYAFRIVTEQLV